MNCLRKTMKNLLPSRKMGSFIVFLTFFYYRLLEIKPCGLGSRIQDVEAF